MTAAAFQRIVSGLAALSALGGCGAPRPSARPAPTPHATQSDAERYFPLRDNTVFAYDTVTEPNGERGVLMLQVRRAHAALAEISIGNRVQRLEVAPDGIRSFTGGYLLKLPLTLGAHWMGQGGEVSVTAVDKSMDVPAGHFVGCIETVEQQHTPMAHKKVTTVFCPHVGMVLLDVEASAGGRSGRERAVLRSFGRKVDIGASSGS
jgi:hypothetical protein